MLWKVKVTRSAEKELLRLAKTEQVRVLKYLRELEALEDPTIRVKKHNEFIVLVLKIGHRKEVYKA